MNRKRQSRKGVNTKLIFENLSSEQQFSPHQVYTFILFFMFVASHYAELKNKHDGLVVEISNRYGRMLAVALGIFGVFVVVCPILLALVVGLYDFTLHSVLPGTMSAIKSFAR